MFGQEPCIHPNAARQDSVCSDATPMQPQEAGRSKVVPVRIGIDDTQKGQRGNKGRAGVIGAGSKHMGTPIRGRRSKTQSPKMNEIRARATGLRAVPFLGNRFDLCMEIGLLIDVGFIWLL